MAESAPTSHAMLGKMVVRSSAQLLSAPGLTPVLRLFNEPTALAMAAPPVEVMSEP